MTRDELADMVRLYADEEHPGWRCASVMISAQNGDEVLLVTPRPDRALRGEPSCSPAQ